MTAPAPPTGALPSLRQRVLRHVRGPLVWTWLLGTVFMMGLANHFTQSAFDRALLDDAYAIASHLRADDGGQVALQLTDSELKAALFDQAEYVYYAVYRADGSQLAGEPLPLLPWDESEPVSYRETLYNGQLVRAVALRSAVGEQQFKVVMMHTTRVRDSLFQHLFLYAAIPQLTLLGLLLWWLRQRIGQDMAPLAALQTSLSQRDAHDLTPIQHSAPATTREIEQLRHTTNALLARIADNVEAQREFAGNVAHEVRTPLAGIKALADYGLGHADPAVQQQQLQRISDSVARASHLVDQLLLLALSDEASAVQLVPVAPADLVQQAVLRHWDAASRARIDLGAEGLDTAEAEQLRIAADANLLAAMLDNLVLNALRYGGQSVTVALQAADDGRRIELAVIDDGPGMSEEQCQAAMQRWQQGASGQSLGQGAGLGLAIVGKLAHLQQAGFSLAPRAGGSGLRASLVFNAVQNPAPRAP
jgi:two-component system sensor histidine kinase TctE